MVVCAWAEFFFMCGTSRKPQTFTKSTLVSKPSGRKAIELLSWWVRGTNLMLHQAGKAQKTGQSTVKLVFDAENVEAFSEK
jgi:hypothetical protein